MQDKGQSRATLVLFLLFFLGLAVTLAAVVDLHWTHFVLVRSPAPRHLRQESR